MEEILFVSPRVSTARLFSLLKGRWNNRILHVDKQSMEAYVKELKAEFQLADFSRIISEDDIEEALKLEFRRGIQNPLIVFVFGGEKRYKEYLVRKTERFFQGFYQLFQTHTISLVAVWNGSRLILACATILAKKLNIPTLFFENGLLPKTLTCDPDGVNYYSTLTGKTADDYRRVVMEPEKRRLLREIPWVTRPARTRVSQEPTQKIPEKFVFLPFQVFTDSQVLIHSDIHSMEELTYKALTAVKNYRQKTGEELYLITKEHPSDLGRKSYRSMYHCLKNEPVVHLTTGNTEELIQKSKAFL